MWTWWPSKVLTLKLKFVTHIFLTKYNIFLQNLLRAVENWPQKIEHQICFWMVTNESFLVATYFSFYLFWKSLKVWFSAKLNFGLIFQAGPPKLNSDSNGLQNGVKTTTTDIGEFTITVIKTIVSMTSVNKLDRTCL